jgi:hypothetical protein
MDRFAAPLFVSFSTWLQLSIDNIQPTSNAVLIDDLEKAQNYKIVSDFENRWTPSGLRASRASLRKLRNLLSKDCTYGSFYALLIELRDRLIDEMVDTPFFSLSLSEAEYYNYPENDWEVTIKRWPNTRIDVVESARCFACARYAGAIFHVLLIAEFGVIEVAKLLGVTGDKPGWGALDRLERILEKPYKERSPIEQTHSELLKQILPLMLAIKESWRHKISHVENRLKWLDTDFSPQIAEEIMTVVRGFMRRLATDLPFVTLNG